MTFSPCYTWPNPAFPFRVYFESDALRIFIIENIFHNYNWLSAYSSGIKETDVFVVILGWHHSNWHVLHSKECIASCRLSLKNFVVLCNDYADFMIFSDHGFSCALVNQNCFLDHKLFSLDSDQPKIYDALYIARLTPFKRHSLAALVANLALVTGELHGGSEEEFVPDHSYRNTHQLSPAEVNCIINQSRTGLILSALEGACFASSEYLLCGVPVVSTYSQGGRSVWYNDYNSIICDATPHDVAKSVSLLVERSPSPEVIRRQHVALASHFRINFVAMLQSLFDQRKIETCAYDFFESSYFHKMRDSQSPDFPSLFPTEADS